MARNSILARGRIASAITANSVDMESIAAQVGIQKGDRVLALNSHEINTTQELRQANDARTSYWRITIERDGRRITQVLRY